MSDELSNNWKEMTDKKSGRKFYYNTVTKKHTWTLPTKEIDTNDTSQTATTVASSSSTTKSSSSDWKEMTDKKSGKKFYYNVKTKKTHGQNPILMLHKIIIMITIILQQQLLRRVMIMITIAIQPLPQKTQVTGQLERTQAPIESIILINALIKHNGMNQKN